LLQRLERGVNADGTYDRTVALTDHASIQALLCTKKEVLSE
jgi:predicted RNA polymerase sigma factor